METEAHPRPPPTDPRAQSAGWRGVRVPALLPVLLPLVLAAIFTGGIFAWLFPPAAPGAVARAFRFTDVTADVGLGFAVEPDPDTPTTLGGGVVCFDYDNDGHSDILLINGTAWPWEEPLAKRITHGSLMLFHNDGTGKFSDATAIAGLNVELQGMAAAVGDFDNDGLRDIFVTCVGANHLFRNRGRGRFEDVTDSAAVAGPENTWSTGATWIDLDDDGRLDLVVCHYARWPRGMDLQMAFTVAVVGHSYGAPTGFVGAFPSVYRNVGDGRFELVAGSAGLRDVDRSTGFPVAKPLAVVPLDVNGDGRLDLQFSYQTHDHALFVNLGDGTFRRWISSDRRQEGFSAGLAAASSLPFAQNAGVDERFSALSAVTSWEGRGGDERVLRLGSKLGVALLDYDFDGRLDVVSGNGMAEPDNNRFEGGRDFQAVPKVFWNRGNGWIPAAPANPAEEWIKPLTARGVATDDFDGDGDLDLVIAQHGASPRLLRNDQRHGQAWLRIELVGTRSNREGYGAKVEVYTRTRTFMQTQAPAMGFMAQSGAALTFGLGEDARVRKVVVHWPSGARQEIRAPAINRHLVVTEP